MLRRLTLALGAAVLAVVVLSSSATTWAQWTESAMAGPVGQLHSGALHLSPSGAVTVHLMSAQPQGWRSYVSPTACTADAGYVECRDVTTTLATESLIPGDRLVISDSVTVAASGDNFIGDLTIDLAPALAGGALAVASDLTVTLTDPAGTATSANEPSMTHPVSVADPSTLGTYRIIATLTTPSAPAQGRWGTEVSGEQLLTGAAVQYSVAQRAPAGARP
ncbi:MAG: hypothetical protein Q4G67_05895 [Actinomycetia bacterium]|nr:hypothetical protein [Actinomycetes bacterium]